MLKSVEEFQALIQRIADRRGQRRQTHMLEAVQDYRNAVQEHYSLSAQVKAQGEGVKNFEEQIAAAKKTNLMIMKNLKKLERWARKVIHEYDIEEPMPTDC